MPKTIFSKIVDAEIPCAKLYEDDHTLAFLDINPLTKGHTLVICKEPIDHLDDCPPEIYAAIFRTVQKVSKQLKTKLKPKRIALVVHGFEIPHAHVHVVPMYREDDMKLADRDDQQTPSDQLNKLAEELAL